MPVDISVVVVTYNSAHVVEGLLDSLPAALDGLTAEVVVVDNGSSDATADLLEKRADCTVVRSTNTGYSAGINRGAKESPEGRAILILNPDARLSPRAARIMLDALDRPGTGVVAPRVQNPDGSLFHSLRREPAIARAIGLNRTGWPMFAEYLARTEEYVEPRIVDWALGAVLLVSRACFDSVGGWDESYFLYSEETDFSLQARDRGYLTRYEPAAIATHIGGQSGQNEKTHAMQIVNRVRLYRRRNGAVKSWIYFGVTVASESTWALRAGARSRFALMALLRPSRRPAELGCSDRLMPS